MSEPGAPALKAIPGSLVTWNVTKEETDKFFALVGRSMSEWAAVDHALFDLCHFLLGSDEKLSAIVFYRVNSLGARKELVTKLAEAKLGDDDLKRLEPIWKAIDENLWVRNLIAHAPTQITMEAIWDTWAEGGPKPIKQGYWVQAITEPKELLTGKAPRVIKIEDLEAHVALVGQLHKDLNGAVNILKHNASDIGRFADGKVEGSEVP